MGIGRKVGEGMEPQDGCEGAGVGMGEHTGRH